MDINKNRFQDEKALERLISLGVKGHFPLFYPQWISESYENTPAKEKKIIDFKNARKNVNEVFSMLKKHRNLERQRTTLLSLSEKDRYRFIQSFMQVVSAEMFNNMGNIH